MNTAKITPKDFFLWIGAMATFYWSVIAYILLVFEYINYAFPNPLSYLGDPYQSGISYEMASLIVLLPTYLVLMQSIRKDIARDPSRAEVWIRRWAILLTLFLAGVTIASDLIILLTTFLSGEALTSAFLLKVLVVLLISGAVFLHFISDLRGYWSEYPDRRRLVVIFVALLAVGTIIAGFFIVGTPQQARLSRFDAQKVMDLQMIDGQIKYFWQGKRVLPQTLEELATTFQNAGIPFADPQTGELYGYQVTGALSYQLCANFNRDGQSGRSYPVDIARSAVPVSEKAITPDSWQHGTGNVCFTRSIDPSFYPPIK